MKPTYVPTKPNSYQHTKTRDLRDENRRDICDAEIERVSRGFGDWEDLERK